MRDLETPSDLLRRIYDEEFGFQPTNASMKPVHVANGMCKNLLGHYYDFVPLARLLRQFVGDQKGGYLREDNPNDAILADYGAHFRGVLGRLPSDEALTSFRSLANDTLGADSAVFPTTASSFTLSEARMVTGDISDNGLGALIASLLTRGFSPLGNPAADLVVNLLGDTDDPWTTIALPMLNELERRDVTISEGFQDRAVRRLAPLEQDTAGGFRSLTMRVLRERIDQLAEFERDHSSKLTALRRLVLFGVFAVHIYMIRRAHESLRDAPLPPILIDMFDGQRRSLREASAATLQCGFRSIERLVVERISENLRETVGEDPTGFVESLPGDGPWELVTREYQARVDSSSPLDALSEAYWRAGYSGVGPESVKGFPWNSLLALGRRSGYLLPYDNRGRGGKEHKRYGASAEFAELLVISTVRPNEPVDFDEFLDRLRSFYGVVVGRPVDFGIIRNNDLLPGDGGFSRQTISVQEADLRHNLNAFRSLITDIGFAKTYADGRTVVTTGEATL